MLMATGTLEDLREVGVQRVVTGMKMGSHSAWEWALNNISVINRFQNNENAFISLWSLLKWNFSCPQTHTLIV